MKHPFSMEKSSATMVELNESETNEVAGGMAKYQPGQLTLAAFDETGNRPAQLPFPIKLPIDKVTKAMNEDGGSATTYAMGEEGGGIIGVFF